MKIMQCPLNGPRNISEFVYGGQVEPMPDPQQCSDKDWASYVFYDNNAIGIVREWWQHAPSSYWFIAERNTVTDQVLRTFASSEYYVESVTFKRVSSGDPNA